MRREIAGAIKTCGLFHAKRATSKACAMMLIANYGGGVPYHGELLKLPGVGRKTANLILEDICTKQTGRVCDTHCIRCPSRLSFVENGKDPVKVEERPESCSTRRVVRFLPPAGAVRPRALLHRPQPEVRGAVRSVRCARRIPRRNNARKKVGLKKHRKFT